MFYVSDISGNIVPFDPRSSAVLSVPSASQLAAPQPVPSAPIPVEVPSAGPRANDGATERTSTANEDAAVFDGRAVTGEPGLLSATDPLTLGRAGAVMAYRVHSGGSDSESQTPVQAESEGVQSAEGIGGVGDESRHRVNPIGSSNYRRPVPPKERKKVVIAADIMNSPVFSLPENTPLLDVLQLFKTRKFRHIPVTSLGGKVVGIISDRNFVGVSPGSIGHPHLIADRMVTNILTARPETEIRAIAEVMIQHRVGCLPILDDTGALVGILTRSDILRAIVNHAPIELWT